MPHSSNLQGNLHFDNPPAENRNGTMFTIKLEKRESNLERYTIAEVYEEEMGAGWYRGKIKNVSSNIEILDKINGEHN
jgi:hypothetical protein